MKHLKRTVVLFLSMLLILVSMNAKTKAAEGFTVTKTTLSWPDRTPIGEDNTVNEYSNIRIDIDFELANNHFNAGNQTVISLPNELTLNANQTFNVTNESGDVIAVAVLDQANKTVTLTYTEYVENHSNITGTLFI